MVTIGVYDFTAESFLKKLAGGGVGLLLDVRQRRGVRGPEYAERYTREILDPFDLDALLAELPQDSATALLCVERAPEACHRSLVAGRLRAQHGLSVTDILPD